MSISFAVCGLLRHLRHRRLELLELAKLPKLDRPLLARGTRVRRALRPLDRLRLGVHVDEPEAADGFFRLRERAVGHDALPPEMRTRVPSVVGCSAATSTRTPACLSSSLYFITAATTSASGSLPASESLLALTNIMNLIPRSPFPLGSRRHPAPHGAQQRED